MSACPDVTSPRAHRLKALSRRPLSALLGATFLYVAGDGITQIGVPWFVLLNTGSAGKAGVVALCTCCPPAAGSLFGGTLVDRAGARRLSVLSDAACSVAVGIIPVLQLTGAPLADRAFVGGIRHDALSSAAGLSGRSYLGRADRRVRHGAVFGHRIAPYVSLLIGYPCFVWLAKAANSQPFPSAWVAAGIAAWLLLVAASELVCNRRAFAPASLATGDRGTAIPAGGIGNIKELVPRAEAAGLLLSRWFDLASYALAVETLTFLFTDIEGSTVLLRRLGEAVYAQVLADHHSLIRSGLADHGGEEVGTQGDGFFAVFSSPRACVAAVTQMQQAIEAHSWPAREHVRVRMGVHTGEAELTPTGLVGLDVHRAARVAAVAHGGQVLLSETAAALVRSLLPPGVTLRDLGGHRLKDLARPEQIFQLDAAGLQAEFPPLRSLGNPALPNNLPAQLATFVGRERELSDARGLVGSSRLVTLTGAGGSGKSRLALQAAAELLDGSGDGVWLVELAAVSDEDQVAPAICQALRIATQPGRPVPETLLDALAPQDLLIVLDNCEHLIGSCAKTADAILRQCPRVQLLATSREPLGITGEAIYRVPPLSLPQPGDAGTLTPGSSDAVALFVERAKDQGVSLPLDEETGRLVVSVCARLDGMPLAIELAAARLRSLPLGALHDRLDQRFRLLTGGSRTALERQQTLEAAVDWSYSLLNDTEQLLLRRLSVFAGSFDLEAAEQVCGYGVIQAFDVTGLLGSLVDKSLVVAEATGRAFRYRLLETIRQFAAERLAKAGADEAAAAAAHGEHFLAVAEESAPHLDGPDQGNWFARLDTEQANLRRATEYAAGRSDGTTRVLRFGAALRKYWMARSRNEEALSLLGPVLERPDARTDPGSFGAALATAATLAQFHDMAAARQLGEQAVAFARQQRDDQLLSYSFMVLGSTYYFAGEAERGFPLVEKSVNFARRLGDDVQLGASLMVYLVFHDHVGPARSAQLFAEAIACTERSGDRFAACLLYNNAGSDALRMGDIPVARAHLEQAAQAMQEIGLKSHFVSTNLAWVLRQEGDLSSARSRFEEALRFSRRNGDRSGLAYASLGLACLTADAGDWYRAGQLHGIAQVCIDRTGESWQEPEARYRHDGLSKVRSALGEEQFERAYTHGKALTLDRALDLALGTARSA